MKCMHVGLALSLAAWVACGNGAGDDGGDPTGMLVVSPGTTTLDVVNGAAASQAFTVALIEDDGTMTDVTGEVTWSVADPAFGSFAGATFTALGARAGKTMGRATLASLVGEAQIEVNVKGFRVGEGAPANAPDLFAGGVEDPASAPVIVYPPDQVIVPQNLGDMEAHWTDGFGHDLYELRLVGDHVDLPVYVR